MSERKKRKLPPKPPSMETDVYNALREEVGLSPKEARQAAKLAQRWIDEGKAKLPGTKDDQPDFLDELEGELKKRGRRR